MPIPQEKKFCGMGILPVLVIFARGLMMARLVSDFKVLPLVSFDAGAATTFDRLQSQRIQLAKMDARIAAIAMFRGLILLTRNHRDFAKVTGLSIEDWTV
ncbi:type II toxin-antitoxin system VapC family toxin [Lyngbya sp. CCAP 1446/10]|uniref:type II toxin-antitoxin system VapC family toxin n=1 Tax=Lyngbya sp. CCAP 1446/10 TaxID=439293 RepID=UPI002237E090|nr:hypothetical protein [Lyngbya sp. CCAP 1446/10]